MQLLAPLFLVGLALIALPFWLHRLKTETPERESFASSMFLQASEDPIHVKRKLRYLVLMSLRILFLLLLALAFAKPFLPSSNEISNTKWNNLHLIVVDASASMAATDKLAKARASVANIVAGLESNEAAQLFSIDQRLQSHSDVIIGSGSLRDAFDQIEVSELALDYATMVRAVEALMSSNETANTNYLIHFISDFQQSSMPSRFADLIAEPSSAVNYQFLTHNISADAQLINLAIEQVEIIGQAARINIRSFASSVDNDEDILEFELRARLNEQEWRSADGEVGSSNRVTITIDGFEFLPQQNQLQIELRATDALTADNTFYRVVNRSEPEPLLLLTDNPYGSSALYISALFTDQSSAGVGRNFIAKAETISSFDARTLNRYSWVLIDDVGSINESLATQLTNYVMEGGSIFLASGPKAETLTNLPIVSIPISTQTDIRQLGNERISFRSISSVDQSHQVLNHLSAWSDLRFEKWLSLEDTDDADVLITLEDGAPLLLEQQLGRGKVMILSSSLDNQWNNLPVKPVFVALMRNAAQYLSGLELIQPAAYAGEALNIQGNDLGAGQLIDPQGNGVLALGDRLQSGKLTMNQLGFYQASTGAGSYVIAVNLPPSESDLRTVPAESLEQWQLLAQRNSDVAVTESRLDSSDQNQQDSTLWLWLLVLAGLAVVFESLLANYKLVSNSRIIQPQQS